MVASKTMSGINTNKLGLFSEMGYITIEEPYVSSGTRVYNEAAGKGRQMLTAGNKTKCGTTSGYFTNEFKRIFEKEAYTDMAKRRRLERLESKKKSVGNRPFLPSSYTKKASGIGGYYGTLVGVGKVDYFSGKTKDFAKREREPRNVLTNPSKKGSGFGYANVTIGKYAEHMSEKPAEANQVAEAERRAAQKKIIGGPFKLNMHPRATFTDNPFKLDKPLPAVRKPSEKTIPINTPFKPSSPSKKPGNCKAGTFEKYPSHPVDGYMVKAKRAVGSKYGVFAPPTIPKTRPTHSLLQRSITRHVNVQNYSTTQTVF